MIFQCPSLALSSLIRSPVSERDCKDTHFLFTSKFFRDFFLTFFIPAPRLRTPAGPQLAGSAEVARKEGTDIHLKKFFREIYLSANFSRCGIFSRSILFTRLFVIFVVRLFKRKGIVIYGQESSHYTYI